MMPGMQASYEPPFPTELLINSPLTMRLNALEMGALYCLATAYWVGQAVDLPNDDAALSVLARCHTRRWYDVRESVLEAWERLRPQLASVYAQNVNKGAARVAAYRANIARAHEASRVKRMKQRHEAISDAGPSALVPLIPQPRAIERENRTNSGETIPKRTLRGQKHALLSDAN